VEITFNGQTAVQVYDGKSGFKYRPYLNRQDWEPYSAQELRQAGSEQELDGPLIDYAAKGTRIAAEGVEQVEGRDAYKLALKLKSGEERHVWIDAQTFLEVRFDGSRMLDGKPHPVWTTLRDYRPVNGLVIPHLIETSVDGVAGSEKIVIEKVALNPALDDSQFGIPPGSKQAPTRAPLAKAD
jgi:outer membrane lipoprotein-sorting protein